MTVDIVRVWTVRADVPEADLAGFHAVLDEVERDRAAALVHPPDRHRFIVAHGSLRLIVARELGAPPHELTWALGRYGKPELAGAWIGPRVNLSHSGDLSMVAMTASRPIGVDVQHHVRGLDAVGMASRFFPPDEVRFVSGAGDATTTDGAADRFAHLWTRKEAVIKAGGGRLWRGLRLPVHGAHTMVVDYEHGTPPGTYRVCDVPAPTGYRAAVALAGDAPYIVEAHEWSQSELSNAATER